MYRLWCVLSLVLAAACGARAEQTATVKGNRVNVRGKATMNSEVITQLAAGETVVVLEEIKVKNPKKNEPGVWARIQLPASTPVYVFAPYIDPEEKVVKVNRLNMRAGPGEKYSVLGRIERGTTVKELRTTDNWMEIEAPASASAFISMEFLELMPVPTPAPTPEPRPTSPTPPELATTAQPVQTQPPPVVANDQPTTTVPVPDPVATVPATEPGVDPSSVQPAPTIPTVPMDPEPVETPRRVVIREGRVVYSRSIQAPTRWALESEETHRLINYLHTEQEGLNLKAFAGRKVFVTGEELLDARWARTPLLDVEDIQVAP